MASLGQLEKMEITAFSDAEFTEEVADGKFITQVNPEKVSLKYEIESPEDQAQGTSATEATFGKIKPQELSFEFMFDATGAIPNPDGSSPINDDGVFEKVKHFLSVVYEYNGEEHKPNNVQIAWGRLLFKCVLKSVNIDYRLFRPDGTPLRAVASAAFTGSVEERLRVAIDAPASPDITHTRSVRDGETLLQLTQEIYGHSRYYLEVARANRLTNFRKLKTGQIISFPPIAKTS
ncbi:MAG: LysM peptidoglycan-binding domain-containing protein [Akkermansiaceae bacterium]|nr:LysM peptidoglycan-binding domain-containing protein [Akkermansiaceae bacterium]